MNKQWREWELKGDKFIKAYGKHQHIESYSGFFWAYNKDHCIGSYHTLKEAEKALKEYG